MIPLVQRRKMYYNGFNYEKGMLPYEYKIYLYP